MKKIAEGYYETELGMLPEDWEILPLEKLNSERKISLNPSKFGDEIFEYYSIPDYQKSNKPSLEKGQNILSQKILLKKGTILFGKLNPRVEKVWLVESASNYRKIGSTEWIPIYPSEFVDSKFLYFLAWSKFVMPVAKTLVSGSTPSRQRVNITGFYQIKVPVPPLSEQKKISAILSALQNTIEKTNTVIEASETLKKSLMKYLFIYGPVLVNEAENVVMQDTEIGMLPEEWDVLKIGEVYELTRKPRNFEIAIDKVPFIPMEYIPDSKIYVERFDFKKPEEITSGTFFFKDDLLVAKITPSFENGKQCLTSNLPSNFGYATTEVWPIHSTESTDILYLFYYLKNHVVRNIIANKMEGSTGRQRVPKNVLIEHKIPVPQINIQKSISSMLKEIDYKIEAEKNKKQSLSELFKSLLNDLMTAKLRVNEIEVE